MILYAQALVLRTSIDSVLLMASGEALALRCCLNSVSSIAIAQLHSCVCATAVNVVHNRVSST
jgi:hypothetical protein